MYGFWRLGFRPRPSAGAAWVSNGLATKTSRRAKKEATPARTGTVHGSTSIVSRRFSATAALLRPVSTSSQSSSDPACPPQNAVYSYGNGSALLECSATYEKEKSRVRKAFRRMIAATADAARQAKSA